MKVLVLDNFDSFTFTLVDYLRQAGAEVRVARSTEFSLSDALSFEGGLLIGPGPGRPEEAGISVPLAAACIMARKPLLGICLGHQAIGLAAGASVVRTRPMHGMTDVISHDGSGLFGGLPSPITATRYHSLTVEDLPSSLRIVARGSDDSVQALRHRNAPVHGIQFHPESVLSQHGHRLLRAFLGEVAGTVTPT